MSPPLVEGFKAEYGRDPRELDERRQGLAAVPLRRADGLHEATEAGHGRGRREVGKAAAGLRRGGEGRGGEPLRRHRPEDVGGGGTGGRTDAVQLARGVQHERRGLVGHRGDAGTSSRWSRARRASWSFNIQPSGMEPGRLRRRASELYRAGAESLFFWNTPSSYSEHWTALRRLGHAGELEAWARRVRA